MIGSARPSPNQISVSTVAQMGPSLDASLPSLRDFLTMCTERDRHQRPFVNEEARLVGCGILGPDDLVRCSTEEIQTCGISLGSVKFMVEEAHRMMTVYSEKPTF
jgi:hypothetical protein